MDRSDGLKFKISAALKNLIGKELITDQYIAIFELVKNAFDAHAKKVSIVFENIYLGNSRIVIIDDGKGMAREDLEKKWLFVAYSAKRDGTEDEERNDLIDYRDKIVPKRLFAGAKGVGRFSCDRLGRMLNLTTIKDKPNAFFENLKVNWEDFEKDAKEEFVSINIEHQVLNSITYNITHGTILEISSLRDIWDRDKLLKLKHSLEKLVNPNQENDNENFAIEIISREEIDKDAYKTEERDKVNGIIKNSLFEKLNIRTTQIITEISSDGYTITSTLMDRGRLIYRIKEKNIYSIHDIKINLFQLNRAAKLNFKKIMGIPAVQYGSVFLYKNGFRVYPFGEEEEDNLGIDRRKQQGYSRFLGTRDLIGRIEISGNNNEFIETTSRDGGLIKNKNFEDLVEFFYDKALKRLEKYVVDVIKWGDPIKTDDGNEVKPALNPEDVKSDIVNIIANLSKTKEIIDVEYDKDFLKIFNDIRGNSTTSIVKNLSRIAEKINNPELQKEVQRTEKQLQELIRAKNEAEKDAEEKETALREVNQELEQTASQNLFLKSVSTTDQKEIISLQHHINHTTDRVRRNLDKLALAINNNASKEELLNYIEKISFENKKISTIARFVTKANFNLMSQTITKNLVLFVKEYIENVYKEYTDLKVNNQLLNVEFESPCDLNFEYTFRPLEVIIILDNLFSNSYKANAKNVKITWQLINQDKIQMKFKDDGKGIPENNLNKIFDFGFTTTNGSGLGLYHVKQIINKMGGSITVNKSLHKGVEFVLEVKK
jgi:signal transduction histidine kinase